LGHWQCSGADGKKSAARLVSDWLPGYLEPGVFSVALAQAAAETAQGLAQIASSSGRPPSRSWSEYSELQRRVIRHYLTRPRSHEATKSQLEAQVPGLHHNGRHAAAVDDLLDAGTGVLRRETPRGPICLERLPTG